MTTTAAVTDAPRTTAISRTVWIALGILLVVGFGLRLYQIHLPPFDFHAQRQFYDAHRARLAYYETLPYVNPEKMEAARANAEPSTGPLVIETLAVWGYRMAGQENLAIPRGIAAFCYVVGAFFLFLLAARLFSPTVALVAPAYYLFLPFAVDATRTFQPDPLMVASVVICLYCLWRYYEQPSYLRLGWAMLFAALAIFIKPMALFFVAVPYAILVLTPEMAKAQHRRQGIWRTLFHPHTLLYLAGIGAGLFWYIASMVAKPHGAVSAQAGKSFIPSLFSNPNYWSGLYTMLTQGTVGGWPILLGLLGILLCRDRLVRIFLLSGTLAYVLFAFTFNYHTFTHSYYNLPLIPILALQLAALAAVAAPAVSVLPVWTQRALWAGSGAVLLLLVLVIGGSLRHPEFTSRIPMYEEIGARVGHSLKVLTLSEEYGDPLRYYGSVYGPFWPMQGDLAAEQLRTGTPPIGAAERMETRYQTADYFIITDMQEFMMQQDLSQYLQDKHAPVLYQAPDYSYMIIDLRGLHSSTTTP